MQKWPLFLGPLFFLGQFYDREATCTAPAGCISITQPTSNQTDLYAGHGPNQSRISINPDVELNFRRTFLTALGGATQIGAIACGSDQVATLAIAASVVPTQIPTTTPNAPATEAPNAVETP